MKILTPSERTELLARFPHESNAALARHFGITADHVGKFCRKRGLVKSPERMAKVRIESGMINHLAPETKAALLEAFPHHSNAALSLRFNVSSEYARKLGNGAGLRKSLERMAEAKKECVAQLIGAKYGPEQVQQMADMYQTCTNVQIGDIFGCDARTVRRIARRYGWKKQKKVRNKPPNRRFVDPTLRAPEPAPRLERPATWGDPRYQVAPGAYVPRVFSLVPPGVDPMTGRGWT